MHTIYNLFLYIIVYLYLCYYTYMLIIIFHTRHSTLPSILILTCIYFWIPAIAKFVVGGDYSMVYNCPCSTIINAKHYWFFFYWPGDTYYKIHISRSILYDWMLLTCVGSGQSEQRIVETNASTKPCLFLSAGPNSRLSLLFFLHVCSPPLPRQSHSLLYCKGSGSWYNLVYCFCLPCHKDNALRTCQITR